MRLVDNIEYFKKSRPTCYQLFLELENQLPYTPKNDSIFEVKISGDYSSRTKKRVLRAMGYIPINKKLLKEFKVIPKPQR